ncbi:MAG: Flp family type IVb pilin [Terracidiphilus sp.]|jgi:pilus assembly protein Flp/PilA
MRPSILGLVLRWQRLTMPEDGQNLVEYALVVALVAFGSAASMRSLASGINVEFSTVVSVLSSSMT